MPLPSVDLPERGESYPRTKGGDGNRQPIEAGAAERGNAVFRRLLDASNEVDGRRTYLARVDLNLSSAAGWKKELGERRTSQLVHSRPAVHARWIGRRDSLQELMTILITRTKIDCQHRYAREPKRKDRQLSPAIVS